MPHATFSAPDLTTFCRLDQLGLEAVGQRLERGRAVIKCRVVKTDPGCHGCGGTGVPRGSVVRDLAHEPFGHRPTVLAIRVRRYRCQGCGRVWREDTSAAAQPRAKISATGLQWALRAIVVDHLSMSRVAAGLGVAWHTANSAVLTEGRRVLIDDPHRFDDVEIIGVDEHVWRHTRFAGLYVTVIIDLTPARNKTGPARLLDMVPGRSKLVFQQWFAGRPQAWCDAVEVVAMDGFSGFKTAAHEELPDAVTVMDPFHVVRLAGDALDQCRRRNQQQLHGHRGRAGDPLYMSRRTLHTGMKLLTDRQWARLDALFATDNHVEIEVTWTIYQKLIDAYRHRDRATGKHYLTALIESLRTGVPTALVELRKLGRTLNKRAGDILAFLRTTQAPPTAPPRPSMGASNTYAAQPWASATSPTTSSAASSRAAASDPNYTPKCDTPIDVCQAVSVLCCGCSVWTISG